MADASHDCIGEGEGGGDEQPKFSDEINHQEQQHNNSCREHTLYLCIIRALFWLLSNQHLAVFCIQTLQSAHLLDSNKKYAIPIFNKSCGNSFLTLINACFYTSFVLKMLQK